MLPSICHSLVVKVGDHAMNQVIFLSNDIIFQLCLIVLLLCQVYVLFELQQCRSDPGGIRDSWDAFR